MARVLITGFCAVPGPRRAGVQLRQVIRSLTAMHSVDLLVVREGEQAYVERQGSVRVLRVPTHEADPRAQIQAFQRALKRQLDGADYDVVHTRDAWTGIPVLEARSRLGYAVVYDLTRSPLGETFGDAELDAQYGRDEEACLLASDLVLAPTEAAVKALHNRGKPERVVLSPPGVDVDRFDWDDVAPASPPRILYTGSIDPGRGVRVLIRAMAAIVREVDCRLVLAGPMISKKLETAMKDGIRELGLDDKVELLGPVDHDQLPTLLSTATVCVVPSAADLAPNPAVLYPTKLLEYMACRCAIVAPRREAVQLVVENAREALLFEPGDPIDLARKVLRLLGEPLLRQRLAAAAYERVRRDFTASATRRALRKAYELIAKRLPTQAEDDDSPKLEILADDDFEATVFEEAPGAPEPPAENTSVTNVANSEALDEALSELEAGGHTSSEVIIAPPPPPDQTQERAPVRPASASGGDEWVVTNVGQAVAALEVEAAAEQREQTPTHIEEGTPVGGTEPPSSPALPLSATENAFVAGEIDVPTPAPDLGAKTPAVEFTAASKLLPSSDGSEDTGSNRTTPPVERRTP